MPRDLIEPEIFKADPTDLFVLKRFKRPGMNYHDQVIGKPKGGLSVKVLALVVPPWVGEKFTSGMSKREAVKVLFKYRNYIKVALIHQYRAITYLPQPDDGTETELLWNVQIELPGGMIDEGEDIFVGAAREFWEEVGLRNAKRKLSFKMIPGFQACAAGTQDERYGLVATVVTGTLDKISNEQKAEGIKKKELIPLMQILDYIEKKDRAGYLIEWATWEVPALLLAEFGRLK